MAASNKTTRNCSIATYISVIIGMLFILLGILCNEWVIARIFSPDGTIEVPLYRIGIWIADIVSITIGSMLIIFKKNARVKNIFLLFFITLIICFIGAELIVRVCDGIQARKRGVLRENPHGTGSYRLRPNFHCSLPTPEGDFEITTNAYGMHWYDVELKKKPGVKRVAFIGDSFTFGCWAHSIESSFVGVCSRRFDKTQYEIMNFGVGGYGLADMALLAEEDVFAFAPDYMILVFFNGNDFRDTYLGIHQYDIINGAAEINKKNFHAKLPPELRMKEDKSKVTLHLSRLFYAVLEKVAGAENDMPQKEAPQFTELTVGTDFADHTFWCQKEYPPLAEKAKDLSLETIGALNTLCASHNTRLIIVSLPFKEQVYASSAVGENFDTALPQRYVEDFARQSNIPYYDLLPVMRAYAQMHREESLYAFDKHLNDKGHKVAGKAIAGFLDIVVEGANDD